MSRCLSALLLLCCAASLHLAQAQSVAGLVLDPNPRIVMENNGTVEVCVTVNPVLTAGQSGMVQVVALSTDAEVNEDFEDLKANLTFGPGEERQCANLIIIDDRIEEGDEAEVINVVLANPQGDIGSVVAAQILNVNVFDSDMIELNFTDAVFNIMEETTEDVCIYITNGTIAEGVTVDVTIDTAEDSTDVDFPQETISLSSDTTGRTCFQVRVVQDDFIEAEEMFTLVLRAGSTPFRVQGNTTLVAQDNDFATVSLNQTSFTVVEGNLTQNGVDNRMNRTVCVVLDNEESGLQRDIVINVETEPVDAKSDVDYVSLNTSITFPSGALVNAEECVLFSVLGDDQNETNEVFRIVFSPELNDTFENGQNTVTVTIEEDGDSLDCRSLGNPDNGVVMHDGNDFGTIATYTCDMNFRLVPEVSRIRECMPGDWNGTDPLCIADCPPLSIENGMVVLEGGNGTFNIEGTVAVYSCNTNFELAGEERRVCQDTGLWSRIEPACVALTCEPLRIDNGGVQHDGFDVGDVATYSCRRGFVLIGESQRVCTRDEVWSGEEPRCAAGAVGLLNGVSPMTVLITTLLALLAVLSF